GTGSSARGFGGAAPLGRAGPPGPARSVHGSRLKPAGGPAAAQGGRPTKRFQRQGPQSEEETAGSLRASWILDFDENVHLLPHIKRNAALPEPVDRLKHARIHPLRAVAGEGFLGNHVGLEANELELSTAARVAALGRLGPRARPHAPGVVLVDVGADVQPVHFAHYEEGRS